MPEILTQPVTLALPGLTQDGLAHRYADLVAAGELDPDDPTLYVTPPCHPKATCLVRYREGCLLVQCAHCCRVILAVAVAA
jgi:hypothetical protein